jgi:hypothetical protein
MFAVLAVLAVTASVPAATLTGQWDFDNPQNLTLATVGNNLIRHGQDTAVPGIGTGDGAARIDVGSYYGCDHGIPANGGGAYVNLYSFVMDVKFHHLNGLYNWIALYNTSNDNSNDADIWISPAGLAGVGSSYSARPLADDTWYRIAITHDGSKHKLYIYCNGTAICNFAVTKDGRWALYTDLVLFFADNLGFDHTIDVSKLMVYDGVLTSTEVANLKGPGGQNPNPEPPLTLPYLQNVKTNEITVMWECATGVTCSLEYGLTTSYGNSGSISTTAIANSTIYKSVLTGLQPNTLYHYKVIAGGYVCPDRTFTTAPSTAIDFSFGTWSDSQDTYDGTWGPPGDPFQPAKSMMQTMVSQGCDFGVAAGDMNWTDGTSYEAIRDAFTKRVARYLGASVPYYVAWGNHDGASTAMVRKFASQPTTGNFSFDYAGCHFTCIDAADWNNYTWIENDLAAAQGAKFIFVFCHYPPYCERWYAGETGYQTNLVPLLEQYGVDVCFSGHVHEYERGFLNDVYYNILGGGSWLDSAELLVYDWPHMTKGGYTNLGGGVSGGLVNNFVRVDVTGNTLTATMIAFNTDGSIKSQNLDSYTKTIAAPPALPWSDGFESGNFTAGGWTTSGTTSVTNKVSYTGTYSAQVEKVSWIQKAISTSAFSNIHVKYARKTVGFDAGEYLYVEWSTNGADWNNLETTQDTAWSLQDKLCGTGANNNADFRVRFRTNTNKVGEAANIDAVELSGTGM